MRIAAQEAQRNADTEKQAVVVNVHCESPSERQNMMRQYADLKPLRLLGQGTFGKVMQRKPFQYKFLVKVNAKISRAWYLFLGYTM